MRAFELRARGAAGPGGDDGHAEQRGGDALGDERERAGGATRAHGVPAGDPRARRRTARRPGRELRRGGDGQARATGSARARTARRRGRRRLACAARGAGRHRRTPEDRACAATRAPGPSPSGEAIDDCAARTTASPRRVDRRVAARRSTRPVRGPPRRRIAIGRGHLVRHLDVAVDEVVVVQPRASSARRLRPSTSPPARERPSRRRPASDGSG